ncbi:hypothetical protein BD324DRAFT_651258 [Kockovaella imperatae]|uniref:Uncharacterized protein n=1 Tax=Kockovaella imperatae TaxID=4999 RepID=A0A1Y1UFE9_9TREE|nr:hypothetical protein BD324DRAFT_651258 [Kockovaella imperatae]ORX36773.1 hypothetical protein BD324DRAFT_651258 [Kockovaella imperatae]
MRPGPSPFLLLRLHRASLASQRRANSTFNPNPEGLSYWARFRPALPTVIAWTIITSLAAQMLTIKTTSLEFKVKATQQIHSLERMIERVRLGEELSDSEIRQELELVGLRERRKVEIGTDGKAEEYRKVSWREALMGRKGKRKQTNEEVEQEFRDFMSSVEDIQPSPRPFTITPAQVENNVGRDTQPVPSPGNRSRKAPTGMFM